MNFWDYGAWSFIALLAVLFFGLLLATALKRKIKILKRSLLPSSVLGGLIILAVSTTMKFTTGNYLFDLPLFKVGDISGSQVLEIIAYHCLAIGFIATSLRRGKGIDGTGRGREVFNTGVTTVSTYLIQAAGGIVITVILAKFIPKLIESAGVLLALGFGQGTGQALNYGTLYEQEHGFSGGANFGLTIAALGFIVAALVGVVHLNILRKKGIVKGETDEGVSNSKLSDFESENEIPVSSSADKLTVQLGIVFCVYAVAYLIMYFLGNLIPGMKATIYGFNFLIGTLCAVLFKMVYKAFRNKKVIKREYLNNFMLSRVSGFVFDLMIVAGIAAIKIDLIAEYWYTLLILAVFGAIATYFYLRFVCKKLFPEYEQQQFLAMFGMLTGTASTGMILLREIDETFETPVAENLVYQNLPAIVFGFPIMLLVSFAPTTDNSVFIVLGACVALFIVLNILLFRSKIFKKGKSKKAKK